LCETIPHHIPACSVEKGPTGLFCFFPLTPYLHATRAAPSLLFCVYVPLFLIPSFFLPTTALFSLDQSSQPSSIHYEAPLSTLLTQLSILDSSHFCSLPVTSPAELPSPNTSFFARKSRHAGALLFSFLFLIFLIGWLVLSSLRHAAFLPYGLTHIAAHLLQTLLFSYRTEGEGIEWACDLATPAIVSASSTFRSPCKLKARCGLASGTFFILNAHWL